MTEKKTGMGRPKKTSPKFECRISLAFTTETRDALREIAETEHRTIVQAARILIDEAIESRRKNSAE